MKLDEYQNRAAELAMEHIRNDQIYMVLGLAGETGEVVEKVKKFRRDAGDEVSLRQGLLLELGDVLWYLSGLARIHDISLDEVAAANLNKLQSRRWRGTLSGSGDNR